MKSVNALTIGALMLGCSLSYAYPPEVFVSEGRFLEEGNVLELKVSYCGNEGDFEFQGRNCPSIADGSGPSENCVEILPTYSRYESCERVVRKTARLRKGIDYGLDAPGPLQNFRILSSRQSKLTLRHPFAR